MKFFANPIQKRETDPNSIPIWQNYGSCRRLRTEGNVGPGEGVRFTTKHGVPSGRSLPLLWGPSPGSSLGAGAAGRHQRVRVALKCGEPE